jgi:hypothetical protein
MGFIVIDYCWYFYVSIKGVFMKKLLLALAVASSLAQAGSFETEFGQEKNKSTGVINQWVALTPSFDVARGLEASVKFESGRDKTAGANLEDKVEARLTQSFDIGKLTLGLRGGVGRKLTQTGSDFNYYLVEPRVSYAVTDSLSAAGSYRYRNAFDSGHSFLTNTSKVGVDYKITKLDEVGVRYAKKIGGDEQSHAWEFTYSRNF